MGVPAYRRWIRDLLSVHLNEFTELLGHVVRFEFEMGLVKRGTIAIEATMTKADASRGMAMSYGCMQSG
jgi:hypothetical protein